MIELFSIILGRCVHIEVISLDLVDWQVLLGLDEIDLLEDCNYMVAVGFVK